MITGGGYHDYKKQKTILSEGISARANVEWTIVLENPKKKAKPKLYEDPNWARGYDVIFHNECFAGYSDREVIDGIVKAHLDAGAASVMIHCAMHTFRGTKTKSWDNLVGVESNRHGAKFRIQVTTLAPNHPVMKGVPRDWVTKNGELYHTKILPSATALAKGAKNRNTPRGEQVCVWTNTYEGKRTFATTIGHHNETMRDPVYLDMVARGLLWACNQLDSKGNPKPGYGPRK